MTVDTAAAGSAPQADQQEHKRATVRPDKAEAVAELAEAFRSASAAVLTEYRGLSVKQISELRRALGTDTTYSVVKNTLTTIAARDAGLTGLDDLLSGPTAVAFVNGDPVEAAKGLRDFAKAHPALVVKGGVMDGQALSVEDVRKLADLESREVLLGKLAGAMLASLSQAVYLLNAPLAQVARLAGALQEKAEQDPSVIGGAGTAPAEQAPVTAEDDAPAADDATADAPAEAAPDAASDAPAEAPADAPADAPASEEPADLVPAVEAEVADEPGTDSSTPDSSTPA